MKSIGARKSPTVTFATCAALLERSDQRLADVGPNAAEFAEWLNSSNSDRERIRKNGGASSSRSRGSALEHLAAFCPVASEFARDLIRPLVEVTLKYRWKCEKQKRKSAAVRFDTFERYVGDMEPLFGAIVKRYPMGPAIGDRTFVTGMPTVIYEAIPNARRDGPWGLPFEKMRQVTERLNQFSQLANAGAFAAFHRCVLPACGKYFHALRPERRYCSKACQRKQYMEHPQRAKKNAADQKVYYYTCKVLDLAKRKDVNAAKQREYDVADKALKSAKRAQKALESAIRASAKRL